MTTHTWQYLATWFNTSPTPSVRKLQRTSNYKTFFIPEPLSRRWGLEGGEAVELTADETNPDELRITLVIRGQRHKLSPEADIDKVYAAVSDKVSKS